LARNRPAKEEQRLSWPGLGRRDWGVLSLYERFEASVAVLLTLVVGMVIVVAL